MSEAPVAVFFDPHPDDVDFWTSGLAMLLVQKGWKVHYICVCKTSEKGKEHANASAKVLGVNRIYLDVPFAYEKGFEDAFRDQVPKLLRELNPRMAFIPPLTDYHQKHVGLHRALFPLFHWSSGHKLNLVEVYAYDAIDNREPTEIFIDISSVWEKVIEALRCFKGKERPTTPDNNLVRIKTGRSMVLGTCVPALPIMYAEGYNLLQGDVRTISSLPGILGDKFYFRSPQGVKAM